jgi:DNA-binding transcriptional LysR family regulator
MELRHLRYLVAIADAGAFVRAAERLHVAQPALTRQMHDLEEELGAQLFDPAARRATLTPAGNACVRLARHVIHDTEEAVARARLSNSGIIGRCVLASGPVPIATGLVPAFLARMRRSFPGITIVVQERSGESQWSGLERAEVDVGLGVEPPATFALLSATTQYLHAIDSVAVAPDHPLAGRSSVRLIDLLGSPLLTLDPALAASMGRVMDALEARLRKDAPGHAPLERRAFSSVESVLAHVRAGQGWTIVPSSMSSVLTGVAIIPLSNFQAVLPSMRIWRRTESRPAVLTVLDQLRRFQENRDADSSAGVPVAEVEREAMPPRIELRHLRSFLAVAEYGSLGRAAEVIGVTQPALSRQMRELEYDVGVALFSRESRGMEITHAGETFRDDVGDVLSVVDKIPQEIGRAGRAQEQRCVIAVVPHPAADAIVARVVSALEGRGERVRVGTRMIMSTQQADALHACEVDIAIGHAYPVANAPLAGPHLITVPLCDDRISVVLFPKNHPLAARPVIRARDLVDIPFIWTTRDFHPAFYDVVFSRLGAAGLRPRVDGEFEGLATIWSMVLTGAGWTLGWKSHLREAPPGLHAVPFADFDLPWGVVMAYRQDEARVPVLEAVDAMVMHASEFSAAKVPELTLPVGHTPEVRIS